jgi:hypothetical protein
VNEPFTGTVETSVGWFFGFSKNHWFQVFERIRIKELAVPGFLGTSESKNCWFWVFQSLQRIAGFDERATGSLTVYIFAGLELEAGTMKILFAGSEPVATI